MPTALRARLIATAAVALMASSAYSAGNLLNNGSFESAVVGGQWAHTNPSNWSSTGHLPVLFNNTYTNGSGTGGPAGDGAQAVQLEFYGDTISQSFTSTAGQAYQLSFMASGYDSQSAPLRASVGALFLDVNGTHGTWSTYTLAFTGTGGLMTVSFENTGGTPGSYGKYPHVDNVSVTAVPEPATYAMMLAGLLAVGSLARRLSSKG